MKTIGPLFGLAIAVASCGPGPDSECGPDTCPTGCCQAGECVAIPRDDACGTIGIECTSCGPARRCQAGQCTEPGSWHIRPVSALLTTTDPRDQLSWDGDDSPPDVVVATGCPLVDGGTEWTDTEQIESYTPTWISGGCRASRQDLLARGLLVDVADRDVFFDDPISTFGVVLEPSDFPSQFTVSAEHLDGGLRTMTFWIGNPQ